MRVLLLIALCAGLGWSSSDSNQVKIETLMDNVLVLRVPKREGSSVYVPLTCGEAYQNQPVFWKKDGMELEPALQGNQVTVLVEEMDGGNYTCHLGPDGEYLNHTVILIQLDQHNGSVMLEEISSSEGHIHCSALNYKGSFHCTWTRKSSRSDATVLLVKAERYLEKITCELSANGSAIHCQDSSCPYKEEQHSISLTIYMRSYCRLEAYTKTFHLRDIVRPAKLPNLRNSDGTVFSWNYPDSWEKPETYFSLEFEVKVVPNRESCHSDDFLLQNKIDETKFEVNVKTKRYVFCVRARDKHTMGLYSHWSHCTVNKHIVTC
ncbi:interleukin-12 subunit beta isoform X2 [Dicentrarchus labrax]|uniref:interleukin-12 subunit beta isoform X2 n=1 Tax=Dicentrarchus labrax TaxID=13489 RepID=UPI0021F61572|nr:interleukin-12 subunit beta isoform X2 [Dicentrarchus labrax]